MISYLFPTPIFNVVVPMTEDERNSYVQKSLELRNTLSTNKDWRCDTFTTLNKYDMIGDPLFSNIIDKIKSQVLLFSKEFGASSNTVDVLDSWINVSESGEYQEYHIHTGSHFSLAYYVAAPKKSGNIVFRSYEADTDMFPLPISQLTPLSYKTFSFEPQEGMLLIFRSNLRHMVEKNLSNESRISISMNLNIK